MSQQKRSKTCRRIEEIRVQKENVFELLSSSSSSDGHFTETWDLSLCCQVSTNYLNLLQFFSSSARLLFAWQLKTSIGIQLHKPVDDSDDVKERRDNVAWLRLDPISKHEVNILNSALKGST